MSDFLVPLACIWMILALAEVDGGATALKSGGIDTIEFLMPYAIMRYLLRDEEQLHAVVKVFCIAAAVAGLLGLLDTFNHSFVLREGLARLTGYQFRTVAGLNPHPDLTQNYRLGLYRATGVFQVPELFGTAMFTALLLCSDLEGRTRRFCILGVGFISIGLERRGHRGAGDQTGRDPRHHHLSHSVQRVYRALFWRKRGYPKLPRRDAGVSQPART